MKRGQWVCGICEETFKEGDENWADWREEFGQRYCHNNDWDIRGGTCWERRVAEDFPEFVEWLEYGYGYEEEEER